MNNSTLKTGTILQGKSYNYQIEKVLGQGSFGIIYLASIKIKGTLGELDSNMKVAIKEFFIKEINSRVEQTVASSSQNDLYENYKKEFIKVAHNSSRLHHPNIVKTLELFETNNTAYLVMEYINGDSLNKYIEKTNCLQEVECIKLSEQIGAALSYMHIHKTLHLDLKPENIMLKDNGVAILIDLGLSKQYDENGNPKSGTKIDAGTPGYSPIEQSVYHEEKGFPTTMDVYAFGATMYKMLTGNRPPAATEILNEGFPTDDVMACYVSNEMLTCLTRAMSPFRKKRYQTIDEMLIAIGNITQNSDSAVAPCRYRVTPEVVMELKENEIFVFGSNIPGVHHGGAAHIAAKKFGAIMGQGIGFQGQSYAIPTMQGDVETIKPYVDDFIDFAKNHQQQQFLVTPIGCGIADFSPNQIAPLFQYAITVGNISLPKTFWNILLRGTYKMIVGEAEYGTEEIIEVSVTDAIPVPDYSIHISLKKKEIEELSYEIYLCNEVCNTIFFTHNGNSYDEDFTGGIPEDVLLHLRNHGFFAATHWERESATHISFDSKETCATIEFFYKDGAKYTRTESYTAQNEYSLLWNAIERLVKETSLKDWLSLIYKHGKASLEDEKISFKWDKHKTSFSSDIDKYGISIFTFINDGTMHVFFRGKTFRDCHGVFAKNSLLLESEVEKAHLFDKEVQLTDIRNLSFEEYINDYKNTLSIGVSIITYCTLDDFKRITKQKSQYPLLWSNSTRVICEPHLMACAFDAEEDSNSHVFYQNKVFCNFETGGGLYEIIDSGLNNEDNASEIDYLQPEMKFRKIKFNDRETFYELSEAAIKFYHNAILNDLNKNVVLLDCIPFSIAYCSLKNNRVRDYQMLIDKFTSIPCKKSDNIDTGDVDDIAIEILNDILPIHIKEEFDYQPHIVILMIDIDAKSQINIKLEDKDSGNIIKHSYADLLARSEK